MWQIVVAGPRKKKLKLAVEPDLESDLRGFLSVLKNSIDEKTQRLDNLRAASTFPLTRDGFLQPATAANIRPRGVNFQCQSCGLPCNSADEKRRHMMMEHIAPRAADVKRKLEAYHSQQGNKKKGKVRSSLPELSSLLCVQATSTLPAWPTLPVWEDTAFGPPTVDSGNMSRSLPSVCVPYVEGQGVRVGEWADEGDVAVEEADRLCALCHEELGVTFNKRWILDGVGVSTRLTDVNEDGIAPILFADLLTALHQMPKGGSQRAKLADRVAGFLETIQAQPEAQQRRLFQRVAGHMDPDLRIMCDTELPDDVDIPPTDTRSSVVHRHCLEAWRALSPV
ncbi:MAG: hypothetical protein KVP17_003645 [Porospora cf. gigantea B]|uniref:uncharacterized protein n=1 Tax=Porospora cf. gigantea B TaxID=2853592 RepID=UPI003571C23A|nr:MAG: hypothetical protein KVP17_003645 [Porospora cf. gigantea B]